MAKAKVIPISFKQKEEWLYDLIMGKSNYSAFVKDCVLFYLENNEGKGKKKEKRTEISKLLEI